MFKSKPHSRRDFIKFLSVSALGSTPFVSLAKSLSDNNLSNDKDLRIFIFSKHLQFLDYKIMCEAVKEIGFDGIDLTVRPNGHVLPESVAEDLPLATEVMKSFELLPNLLTTSVSDANNELDIKVIELAAQLGYNFYRPGWFRYRTDNDVQESLLIFKEKIKALAVLNKRLGISGSYQNHSGHYMGASIWDLDKILEGISPKHMGCQYDIMHSKVEGGKNWEIDFRAIRDHINTLVVKDFKWGKVNGKWRTISTQLGDGMVNFSEYFSLVKKYNINVPISLHCEYDLGGAERGGFPTIDKKEVFRRLKKDLDYIRKVWKEGS